MTLYNEKKEAIRSTQERFPTMSASDVLIYVEEVLGYPAW